MEMPEGLIIAYHCDSSTDSGSERIKYALDLLKEMAEIMKRVQFCLDHPMRCELTGDFHTDAVNKMSEWLSASLMKFQEWK